MRSEAFSPLQYDRGAHVVAIPEFVRRQLIADGIAPANITTTPSAIDTKRFRPIERSPELAREFGIERGDVVVGNVSSPQAHNGIDTILRAFAMLRSDPGPPDLRLLLAGKSRERWVALARELGVEERVLLPGFREGLPEVLASPSGSYGSALYERRAEGRSELPIALGLPGLADAWTHVSSSSTRS